MFTEWLPILYFIGFFFLAGSTVFFNVRTGAGQASKDTIKILQDKDNAQQTLINDQSTKITIMQTQINKLEVLVTEKEAKIQDLVKIFQGRDKQTLEFQQQGFKAIKQSNEILALTKSNAKMLESLEKKFEQFLDFQMKKNGKQAV